MLTLTDANGAKLFPILWHRYDSTREGRSIVHEYASGQLAITNRPAKNRRVRVRLLFNDETAAYVAELMHAHAAGPLTISDPEVPSVGMSYAVVEGSQVRREQVEGHPGIWFVEADALDTQSPTINEAAPMTHVDSNWCEVNPGMRDTTANIDTYTAGTATVEVTYATTRPEFVSGKATRVRLMDAPAPQQLSFGPKPQLLEPVRAYYPDRVSVITWRVYNPAPNPRTIYTTSAGLAGEVRDISPPMTIPPLSTVPQWLAIMQSGPQPGAGAGAQIRSRVDVANEASVMIGDLQIYTGGYSPAREFFDGDLEAPDALTSFAWLGTPNASRSSRRVRRLVVM